MSRLALGLLLCATVTAMAQTQPTTPRKDRRFVPGTPLDTLMSTHLTTKVPEAAGFVQDSRPDPKTLDYAPLTGTDPERPKPRDAANVQALQAELEQAGASNARKAGGLRPNPSHSTQNHSTQSHPTRHAKAAE